MAITINVGAINPITERVHIYKAVTAHISQITPGTPWRTLTPAEAAQPVIDEDYPSNTYVAYRIGVEYQGSINVGPEVVIGTWAETGYGPQELIRGDMSWGFFGKISSAEFITLAAISAKISYSALGQSSPVWFKCAYEGRILYFPSSDQFLISPSAAHSRGAMFGMDAKGPAAYTSLPTIPQTATMQFDGRSYRLRLPRLADYPTGYNSSGLLGGETAMMLALVGGSERGTGFNYSRGRQLSLDSTPRRIITSQMVATGACVTVASNGSTASISFSDSVNLSFLLEYAPGV